MMNHLSSQQISSLLADGAMPEEIKHARECAECAAAVAELRETFSMFSGAVQHWSERNGGSFVPDTTSLRREWRTFTVPRFALGMAAAVLVFLIALPVYKNMNNHAPEPGPDDALLLEQVNAHLSRAVPAPMEPLMKMMADDSAVEAGGHQ